MPTAGSVDVSAVGNERFDRGYLATKDGAVQGGGVVLIGCVDVGAVCEEKEDDITVAVKCCEVEWRVLGVEGVDVVAAGQGQLG